MMLLVVLLVTAQAPVPASQNWVTAPAGYTAFACAKVDRDGYDDVLALDRDGRLFVSPTVEGKQAAGWKLLSKKVPHDLVGLGRIRTDRQGHELALVTRTRLLVMACTSEPTDTEPRDLSWRLVRQPEVDESRKLLPPVRLSVAEACAVDGLLWVLTPEAEWWRLRTAGSFFDGPFADPRPPLLTVSPPSTELTGYDGARARSTFWGDLNGDGHLDSLAAFPVTKPDEHFLVRVTFGAEPKK